MPVFTHNRLQKSFLTSFIPDLIIYEQCYRYLISITNIWYTLNLETVQAVRLPPPRYPAKSCRRLSHCRIFVYPEHGGAQDDCQKFTVGGNAAATNGNAAAANGNANINTASSSKANGNGAAAKATSPTKKAASKTKRSAVPTDNAFSLEFEN